MKNILEALVQIEKNKAYQILNKAATLNVEIQIKIIGEEIVVNTKLKKIGLRKHFYITSNASVFESKPEVTLKIIFQNRLFFLKTHIKKFNDDYYFENYENFFELIRRKNPRFLIPSHWSQSAIIQSAQATNGLKCLAKILEMSKSGMKLTIGPVLPRYEKNHEIKLKFKVFKRGEITLSAKIVHLKKNIVGGPTVGIQFIEDSILLKNKILNVCDDLAFFYVAVDEA
mgnify:CR=1 FL=1